MKNTTGKKKSASAAAAAAGTAGGLKKVHGDWQRSSVDERQLEALHRDGFLPPLERIAMRPSGDEVAPYPRDGEHVCFVNFVNRGFAVPVHEFVRGLMYAYGVQLHDFTPNAILHINCFIVLCNSSPRRTGGKCGSTSPMSASPGRSTGFPRSVLEIGRAHV